MLPPIILSSILRNLLGQKDILSDKSIFDESILTIRDQFVQERIYLEMIFAWQIG